MLKLLGRNTSGNVQKVIFLLEEMGTPYEREDYGRQFNNTGGDYLKLNPFGKVPTLLDGDLAVWESHAILRYVAAKFASPLYPSDLAARSQVDRWMDWLLASLNPGYVTIFVNSKKPEAERGPFWPVHAQEVAANLSALDAQLAKATWIAGDRMSLADIALGPLVHRCLAFPIELPAVPKLKAWHQALLARPAFKKAVG
jgi:glutathione S-transferase